MRFSGFLPVLASLLLLSAAAQSGIAVLKAYDGSESFFSVRDCTEINGTAAFSASMYQGEYAKHSISVSNRARSAVGGSDSYFDILPVVSIDTGTGRIAQELSEEFHYKANSTSEINYVVYRISGTGATLKIDPAGSSTYGANINNNTLLDFKVAPEKTRSIEITLQTAKTSPAGEYKVKIDFLMLDV